MRIARAVAFAIAIAAPLAMFLWLRTPAADRGGTAVETRRDAASDEARRASSESPLAPPAPAPTREPAVAEPAAKGNWQIELDLRAPGDAPLARGRVHATPPKSAGGREEGSEFAWRRDAATIDLARTEWTLVAEAESDPSADTIPCGDLVSDPVALDPKAPPPAPLVVRLHARPGIYGRLLDLPAAAPGQPPACPRCGVRWQRLAPGRSVGAGELALRGHDARVVEIGGGGLAYVAHDLEPGRYAIAARDDPAHALEEPVELEVGDTMVRRDLSVATIDTAAMLHVVVEGLTVEELSRISFLWIESGGDSGRDGAMVQRSDAPGSFWVWPARFEARSVFHWVLDGVSVVDVKVAVALVRDGVLSAAQPVTSGQHQVVFACDPEAKVRIRCDGPPEEVARLRLLLVPASAAALLQGPDAMLGDSSPMESGVELTLAHLVPGDFVASIWGQLHSDLNHGEVWWPLARRAVTLHGGDQEIALEPPPLHSLTIRFDRARFGSDARVRLVLREYARWPIFAAADESGIARYAGVPDGDYTVTVVGDMSGEKDFTMPGTSEVRIEPTRREEH